MKKLIPSVALLLTAAGSWAFYPKAATESEYMTVTLYINGTGRGNLVVTAPDGSVTAQDLGRKLPTAQLRGQLLGKVNELHR